MAFAPKFDGSSGALSKPLSEIKYWVMATSIHLPSSHHHLLDSFQVASTQQIAMWNLSSSHSSATSAARRSVFLIQVTSGGLQACFKKKSSRTLCKACKFRGFRGVLTLGLQRAFQDSFYSVGVSLFSPSLLGFLCRREGLLLRL